MSKKSVFRQKFRSARLEFLVQVLAREAAAWLVHRGVEGAGEHTRPRVIFGALAESSSARKLSHARLCPRLTANREGAVGGTRGACAPRDTAPSGRRKVFHSLCLGDLVVTSFLFLAFAALNRNSPRSTLCCF